MQVHIRPRQRAMDFPELGPAVLDLAEIAPVDFQLVLVLCVCFLDGLWLVYFNFGFEREGAGSG